MPGFLELALDDDLGRDAGVVGARHPQRVVALHPVVAHQRVHDRVLERVPHVQRAGHVRRRQLDAERGPGGIERRLVDAALFPQRPPVRLDGGGVEGLGEFGHGVFSRTRAPFNRRIPASKVNVCVHPAAALRATIRQSAKLAAPRS